MTIVSVILGLTLMWAIGVLVWLFLTTTSAPWFIDVPICGFALGVASVALQLVIDP